MKTYGHIVIAFSAYSVVLVVDGLPVMSQGGLTYSEALTLKTLWGSK